MDFKDTVIKDIATLQSFHNTSYELLCKKYPQYNPRLIDLQLVDALHKQAEITALIVRAETLKEVGEWFTKHQECCFDGLPYLNHSDWKDLFESLKQGNKPE